MLMGPSHGTVKYFHCFLGAFRAFFLFLILLVKSKLMRKILLSFVIKDSDDDKIYWLHYLKMSITDDNKSKNNKKKKIKKLNPDRNADYNF